MAVITSLGLQLCRPDRTLMAYYLGSVRTVTCRAEERHANESVAN